MATSNLYNSKASVLGMPLSEQSANAAATGNWKPGIIPANATPEQIQTAMQINRQGMAAASTYKPVNVVNQGLGSLSAPTAAATSPYRLPDGTMDEPDKPGVRDEKEPTKRKAKRNPNDMGLVFHPEAKVTRPSPNSLGYSQSYDPNGRGYKQLNGPINPQSAAALRSKFKTPSNLG